VLVGKNVINFSFCFALLTKNTLSVSDRAQMDKQKSAEFSEHPSIQLTHLTTTPPPPPPPPSNKKKKRGGGEKKKKKKKKKKNTTQ